VSLDLGRVDTIAAPATAPGSGAVAVLRVSGPAAEALRDQVFSPRQVGPYRAAELRLGDVVAAQPEPGAPVDEAMCAWFPVGRSYTGEAAFELHIHGGALNTRRVLELLRDAGARLAEPGEFTLRAFLNGRVDLAQAEAVQQIVGARSAAALELAQRDLRGAAGEALRPVVAELTQLLAELEARLDFPEEDLAEPVLEALAARVATLHATIAQQRATAATGARVVERPRVVLGGPPNAGKSTLLNALCEQERALTHPEAGTTRDLLEAPLLAGGLEVTLVDSAGLRAAASGIESEAVTRSRRALTDADVKVLVVDASRPLDEDALAALADWRDDALLVANKRDLDVDPGCRAALGEAAIVLSALQRQGIATLRSAIEARARPPAELLSSGWLVTSVRHAGQLESAEAGLVEALRALRTGEAEEVAALELRRALQALAQITGGDPTEDVLGAIFSRFCIGK